MEIDKFVELINESSPSYKFQEGLRCMNYSGILLNLWLDKRCVRCGNECNTARLYIQFKQPQKLTVFEAQLIYSLFVLKRRPYDYAQYHKCEAGKKFIENIENYEVN